jgi:hypothetical protein
MLAGLPLSIEAHILPIPTRVPTLSRRSYVYEVAAIGEPSCITVMLQQGLAACQLAERELCGSDDLDVLIG